jgi:hypothetical protein
MKFGHLKATAISDELDNMTKICVIAHVP